MAEDKQKSAFDLFSDTRKALTDAWEETTQKILDTTFGQETVSGKGAHIFVDMLKQQKALLDELTSQPSVKDVWESSPEMFKKWLDSQKEFGEQWATLYKEQSGKYLELAPKQVQEYSEQFQKTYEEWESWVKDTASVVKDRFEKKPDLGLPTFAKAYDGLQNAWGSIREAIETGIYSKETINKWMPLQGYEKIVDAIIGLQTVDNLKQSSESVDKMFSAMVTGMQQDARSLYGASRDGVQVNLVSLINFSAEVTQRMQQTSMPFVNMVAQDKAEAWAEKMNTARDHYRNYMEKTLNLQLRVYDAAKDGLLDTIERNWKNYQTEGDLPKFDQFASQWIREVEDQVSNVLKSDEYQAIQEELKTSEKLVKENLDEILEETTKSSPFVLRSEVDSLKSEIEALKEELKAAKKKPTTRKTTTKAKSTTKTEA